MNAIKIFAILTVALGAVNLIWELAAKKAQGALEAIEQDLEKVKAWLMAVTGNAVTFAGVTPAPVPQLMEPGTAVFKAGEWHAEVMLEVSATMPGATISSSDHGGTSRGGADQSNRGGDSGGLARPSGPSVIDKLKEEMREAFHSVCSPLGVMGLVATPLFLVALYVNSMIIADRLWTIFQVTPRPIFVFYVLGGERVVTFYDVIGLLVSLLQASSATIALIVVSMGYNTITAYNNPVYRWVRKGSFSALAVLVGFEVFVNVKGALEVAKRRAEASPMSAGAIAFFAALGVALAVAVLGAVSLHFFLLPVLTLVLGVPTYLIALVVRRLSRQRGDGIRILSSDAGRGEMFGRWRMLAGQYRIFVSGPSRSRILMLRVSEALGKVLFDPLRAVDRVVSAIWTPFGSALSSWWGRRFRTRQTRRRDIYDDSQNMLGEPRLPGPHAGATAEDGFLLSATPSEERSEL